MCNIGFSAWYLIPHWLRGKESACNAAEAGLIPWLEDPLEKEMPTHSSILAWEIPWTEEPDGLHTVNGVTRVRHYLATKPPPPMI